MTTTQRIQNEINTLPNEAQDKVLAYIEWLKYKALVKEVEQISSALQGLKDAGGDLDFQQLIQSGHPLEDIRERLQIVQRTLEVLERAKKGLPGIPNEVLKQQARQWRSK